MTNQGIHKKTERPKAFHRLNETNPAAGEEALTASPASSGSCSEDVAHGCAAMTKCGNTLEIRNRKSPSG